MKMKSRTKYYFSEQSGDDLYEILAAIDGRPIEVRRSGTELSFYDVPKAIWRWLWRSIDANGRDMPKQPFPHLVE
jgi:hypothetical protein